MSLKGYYIDCSDLSFEYPYVFLITIHNWIQAHGEDEPVPPFPGIKNRDYVSELLPSRPIVIKAALDHFKGERSTEDDFIAITDKIVAVAEGKYDITYGFVAVGFNTVDNAALFRLMID